MANSLDSSLLKLSIRNDAQFNEKLRKLVAQGAIDSGTLQDPNLRATALVKCGLPIEVVALNLQNYHVAMYPLKAQLQVMRHVGEQVEFYLSTK